MVAQTSFRCSSKIGVNCIKIEPLPHVCYGFFLSCLTATADLNVISMCFDVAPRIVAVKELLKPPIFALHEQILQRKLGCLY